MLFSTKLLFFVMMLLQNNPEFVAAEKLYQEGNYNKSEKLFSKIYQEDNTNYKAKEYLGDIAGKQSNWDKAINHYEVLKNKFPNNAIYIFKYGGCLGMKAKNSNKFKALSMIDEVEKSLLKAASLDKNMIEVRWALVELYLELPAIIGGSEKKSRKYANELLEISTVDGYLALGRIEMYFKRYKSAEKHYIKAHQIGNSETTFKNLFNLYSNQLKSQDKANQLKLNFLNKKKI